MVSIFDNGTPYPIASQKANIWWNTLWKFLIIGERAQYLTQKGFRLIYCLLNFIGVTWTNYEISARKYEVGIIPVLSQGDREKEMKSWT